MATANNSVQFVQRRQRLIEKMANHSLAIIAAAPEYLRNGDNHYLYRQDSNFYYLTGFMEPGAVAVLQRGNTAQSCQYFLFNRPRDPLMETWNGRRAGQAGAVSDYGATAAYPINEFVNKLPELLSGCQSVYYPIGRQITLDQQIMSAVNNLRGKVRAGAGAPLEFINIDYFIHEMRLRKSDDEIVLMRQAAQIAAQAHCRAMRKCRPGLYEYELEAELLYEFYRQGSRSVSYNPIIGGGANSCILHYNENNAVLKDGDILLIDAGCEYQYYAADITRTFPVNGRFTAEQKAIYELVLAVQETSIKEVQPGNSWNQTQETAVRMITEGLVGLKILAGNVEDLIQKKAYEAFYMHRAGHWLGLDVHDAGNYKIASDWRPLEVGMAFTIEPGIYIAPNNPNVDKKWWNIGVRIEDDVVVTQKGCEVLSAGVPKTIADIQAIMSDKIS